MARAPSLVPLALAAAALTGCGKSDAPKGRPTGATSSAAADPAPDLSTPAAALAAAVVALDAGDLAALDRCLTAAGAERVRRDLAAWKDLLADPASGPRALARIPAAADDGDRSLYVAAFRGDAASLLRLLTRAQGGGLSSAVLGTAEGGASRVEGERIGPDGTRRRIVLVREGASWRADRIAL